MTAISSRRILLLLALSFLLIPASSGLAVSAPPYRSTTADIDPRTPNTVPKNRPEFAPGRLIVRYKAGVSDAQRGNLRAEQRLETIRSLRSIGAEVVRVKGRSAQAALGDLKRRPEVEFATLDYLRYPSGYADEPRFGEQWGNHNTGQAIQGVAGAPDVDLNAPEAAVRTMGDPNLVVAVVDDGVDFSHPDLAERRWINPGESGTDTSGRDKASNKVDDDGNGYVDDVHGWDFCNDDNTAFDAIEGDAHGTHVAGTLAASMNGQGIAGIAPNIEIMALKFICRGGGADSNAVRAWEYARDKGVRIVNNSWGGGGYSPAIEYFIDDNPMFFVFAAGNEGGLSARFPASLPNLNVLSVAAIDNKGELAPYSNSSQINVDVAAPGSSILSAVPAIPERSALALSSYATGRAAVAGFGIEEISLSNKRSSFARRALAAIGRTAEPIVVVDDDRSGAGLPDGRYRITEAVREATGVAPQVINVASGNGPALSQLSGKVVVWSTGWAYESGGYYSSELYPLTPTDQTTLTSFLSGGGKLILNGLDTLRGIEASPFVSESLGLDVLADVGNRGADRLVGRSGTSYGGEAWDLAYHQYNNPDALPRFHDLLSPAGGSSAASLGVYPASPMGYEYWDGTSMAAPHASGAAALVASIRPQILDNPSDLRSILMYGSKPAPATAGKTVTGRMLDARAAMDVLSETTAPSGSVVIDYVTNPTYTNHTTVQLILRARDTLPGSGLASMRFSNDGASWSAWKPYDTSYASWQLTPGDGPKTVYVQFRDVVGNVSDVASDGIILDSTRPTVTAPEPRFVPGSALAPRGWGQEDGVPVRLTWSGSDNVGGSGLWRFILGYAQEHSFREIRLPTLTSTSVTELNRPDLPAQYRIHAEDVAENMSDLVTKPEFTIVQDQETSPAVTYPSGAWSVSRYPTYSWGSVRQARDTGAVARFRFSGSEVAWVSTNGPDRGKAEVRLDGTRVATVDLYAPAVQTRRVAFARTVDPRVEHTLEIVALGTGNTAATGTAVDVDTFLTRVDPVEANTYITDGPYGVVQTSSDYFTHTSTFPSAAFECSLDGAPYAACQHMKYYENLGDGPHTFLVRASSGAAVDDTPARRHWFIDTRAPQAALSINNGSGYASSSTVTLYPSGTDTEPGSGLHLMRFSNDGHAFTEWEPYAQSKRWTVLNGNGTKTVYAQVRDRAGNISSVSSVSIVIDSVAPTVAGQAHALVGNTALGTGSVPVGLSWSASDATSGVAKYQLQQRKYSGGVWGTWGWVSQGTTAKTLTRQLALGTYQFQVRAQDKAGNWSAWKPGTSFAVAAYQEASTAAAGKVTYGGTWATQSLSSHYGGAARYASAAGRTASFTFTGGRQVAWVAPRGTNRGYAHVYLDGAKVATVNLYASSTQYRRVVFAKTGLSPSVTHTLKVYVPGTKPSSSTGTRVDIDGFVVLR